MYSCALAAASTSVVGLVMRSALRLSREHLVYISVSCEGGCIYLVGQSDELVEEYSWVISLWVKHCQLVQADVEWV